MRAHRSVHGVQSAAAAEQPLVVTQVRDGLGLLTLNHPAKRNALSRAMLDALREQLARMREDSSVRAIILAANGPVFSSGHDLKEFVGASPEQVTSLMNQCTELMESLRLIPKPVLAQVAGLASAAGCQLAASCDLIVASRTAQFQTPGVQIGLFCSTPMIPLSRAVPAKKALEMLFTGDTISAAEAERHGLVNRVVEPDDLAAATEGLARHIISYSASTLAVGKLAFYRQLPLDRPGAYRVGVETMQANAQTADAQEGMSAFLQKRAPKWKD